MTKKFKFIVNSIVLVSVAFLLNIESVTADSGTHYTELNILKPAQKQALKKLKDAVSPIVPQDYMKEDIYLVKFLEANQYHVDKSVEHMKTAIKWRKENKIDEYLENPPDFFQEFHRDFPIYTDGLDKKGRPICEIAYGTWPFRKAAIAGKVKKITQYFYVNCAERVTGHIRRLQAEGKNTTQAMFISDMDGFTLAEQGCPACIPFILSLTAGNEKYYPNVIDGLWLVNTPDSFATVARLMRPIMSPKTREGFKVFSSNEAEWRPFVEKRVQFSQLFDWYGGGKEQKQI